MNHLQRCGEWASGIAWCSGPTMDETVQDVADCTCLDCLRAVIDYAEDARYRLSAISDRDMTKPDCECRTGAHPARLNYLSVPEPKCKLGWPL